METTAGSTAFEEPIRLPGSPFWNVFKRFGRDEMIALIINVCGTALTSIFTSSILLLSIAGPLVEKIGFFPAHFYEAYAIYKTTPRERRKKLRSYFGRACRNGSLSLLEDVCIHDPVYILLFCWALAYPGVPPWLLAAFSFVVATGFVAFIEVTIVEIGYLLLQRRLRNAGFEQESYYESRFLIRVDKEAVERLVVKLSEQFNLRFIENKSYEDRYFGHKLPEYSGRKPVLRLRRRTLGPSDKKWLDSHPEMARRQFLQTAQIVYTRANEARWGRLDQFRFFLIAKEKFYLLQNQTMPGAIKEVVGCNLEQIARAGEALKEVRFQRTVLKNWDVDLIVAIDQSRGKDVCVVEVKTFKDTNLLCRVMRVIMLESSAIQMTMRKLDWDF